MIDYNIFYLIKEVTSCIKIRTGPLEKDDSQKKKKKRENSAEREPPNWKGPQNYPEKWIK